MALDKNIKKLQTLLGAFEEDYLSRQDFQKAFMVVVDAVKKARTEIDAKADQKSAELSNQVDNALAEIKGLVKDFEKKTDEVKESARSDSRTTMRLIEEKISSLRDEIMTAIPEVFDDSELKSLIEEVKQTIPELPKEKDVEGMIAELKDWLEEEHKAFQTDVDKKIASIPKGGGGGTSAPAVARAFKYIAHTEAPVGDIDGVNTEYTVKNHIWWIAGFTLNGEQIAELPNFTYQGSTITFSSAIPAAYSGKDFEIKYIGT